MIHDRAETFSAKNSPYREKFDIVTARAVARLSVLSELCLPAAKVSGEFIAYKASAAPEELQQGGTAIKQLGGKVQKTVTLTLPGTDEERNMWRDHWTELKNSVIEVKCQEITEKSLRHPVFVRFREDKDYKMCTRNTIFKEE